MSVALGLVFALVVIWTPFFDGRALMDLSPDPGSTMAVFVGTVVSIWNRGRADRRRFDN